MSLKKYLVSGAAALALVGTAAMAASVHIEKDGTGDYLIAPAYFANSASWSTKIKVVNTNTTAAVIAKVIIREGVMSKELVDFPLFLTPGDVFEGTLHYRDGAIYFDTDDDSVKLAAGQHGLQVNLTQRADILRGQGFSCVNETKGYVEIIGLGDVNMSTLKSWDSNWTGETCPYDKEVLFDKIKGGDITSLNLDETVPVADSDLMGQQIIMRNVADNNGKRAMFLNMLAFGGVSEATISGNGVLGTDQNIKTLFGAAKLNELKDELTKSHAYVMYEGNADYKADPFLTIFTYPYWKNEDSNASCATAYKLDENTTIFRDMSENSNYCDKAPCVVTSDNNNDGLGLSGPTEEQNQTTCPKPEFTDEVSIIFLHDPEGSGPDAWANKYLFSSGGYIDIKLPDSGESNVWKGLPIIPTTFYAKKVGDLYLNNHLYNQYLKEKK